MEMRKLQLHIDSGAVDTVCPKNLACSSSMTEILCRVYPNKPYTFITAAGETDSEAALKMKSAVCRTKLLLAC